VTTHVNDKLILAAKSNCQNLVQGIVLRKLLIDFNDIEDFSTDEKLPRGYLKLTLKQEKFFVLTSTLNS